MGDSGMNMANAKNKQHGKAETLISLSKDNVAAQAYETPTNKFMFTVVMIERLPRNRINDISLKYILVELNDIPMPEPIKHLATKSMVYEGEK